MSAAGLNAAPRGPGRLDETHLYGAAFAVAVAAFCLAQAIGPRLGLASELIAIAGSATCGWSWLLVRALFQPPKEQRGRWPLVLVLVMVATNAVLHLSGGTLGPATRMAGNVSALVSSAFLLLAAIEPLVGLRRDMAIKSACAVAALAGMGAAIWYRGRHPLTARRRAVAADGPLGERVARMVAEAEVYAQPGLKVADVARRLSEPEYRVTQAVTGTLGFRNFSDLVNHHRIAEAKRRLADPAMDRLPILTVAYDCGFGSIGPFNRAFKAATRVTPQQYRRTAKAGRAKADFLPSPSSPMTPG